MVNESHVSNYVNTIIFCVVLKIISIIVLAIVLFNFAHPWIIYVFVTVEIGVIVIITMSLVTIASYEKRKTKEANNLMSSRLDNLMCPDYHTRTEGNVCVSNYTTGDGRYTYTFANGSNVLLDNYANKQLKTVCTMYDNETSVKGISHFPWTYINAKCESI